MDGLMAQKETTLDEPEGAAHPDSASSGAPSAAGNMPPPIPSAASADTSHSGATSAPPALPAASFIPPAPTPPLPSLSERVAAAFEAAREHDEQEADHGTFNAGEAGGPPPLGSDLFGHQATHSDAADVDGDFTDDGVDDGTNTVNPPHQRRRTARRRPAGPARNHIAANDEGPSIGGLIFALQQKPSNAPFRYAGIASIVWAVLGVGFTLLSIASAGPEVTWLQLATQPTTLLALAAIFVPIALLWLMALLAWRTEELRLRSSTMAEVAIRLAEPDRMAEQNAATIGQAVRRQVGFMNDAVSRALGRAGELEAMVHNEVSVLERSYEENERKIRGLIAELSGERHALVNTSDRVSESLMRLGSEIPTLIEKLSEQQIKLASVIEGAGENLTMLESSLANSVGNLEHAVGGRTEQLQVALESYTTALADAFGNRTEQLQSTFDNQLKLLDQSLGGRAEQIHATFVTQIEFLDGSLETRSENIQRTLDAQVQQLDAHGHRIQTTFDSQLQLLDHSLGNRTENLQTVFEEYARALDAALANRAQALDYQLVERTRSLDEAFGERLRIFDESIMRSTQAIDSAVVDKTQALTSALDQHAVSFRESIGKQAADLDEALMHGINSVRRASENITRQSLKAMEGLAGQTDLLKNISENLLNQISGVTGRFENQGQQIMKAANALETVNYKIDKTLQNRHAELNTTLDRLAGKADEFSTFVGDYSSTMVGSLSEADLRARAELERMREAANQESQRTLEDLRNRLDTVSSTVTSELGSLTDRFASTSEEMRQHAARTASEIAAEQARLRSEMERLPVTAHESSEGMRRALQDQIKALDQLSQLASRSTLQRDITPPPPSAHIDTSGPAQQPSHQNRAPQQQPMSHPAGPATHTRPQHASAPPQSGGPAPSHQHQPHPQPQRPASSAHSITSLSSTIAQELGNRQRQRATSSGDGREAWSLGDLLARASLDDEPHGGPHGGHGHPMQAPFSLDLEAMARALDPATATAIWSRLRAGQRGVMVRSIYSNEGRALFDDVMHRCRNDHELANTVSRYLTDFERIIADSDARDPSGRMSHSQLVSETGRVYLFLAHASGRLG
ncbi:hypothetical protein APY04_2311 [Hyphomicrobium sulfonivorans]|uniref:Uncharacterized protein n=2 Tax=Hyphomicrobium sulfonivorans TaxID=121290 RepID=A0A109BDP6_HYPSL|nr:hypothetical protein APY04_2311 [Hyphomicrobium sulfonivorans]